MVLYDFFSCILKHYNRNTWKITIGDILLMVFIIVCG